MRRRPCWKTHACGLVAGHGGACSEPAPAPAVAKGEAPCECGPEACFARGACTSCGGWYQPAPVAAREPSADEVEAVAVAYLGTLGLTREQAEESWGPTLSMARVLIRALDEIRGRR